MAGDEHNEIDAIADDITSAITTAHVEQHTSADNQPSAVGVDPSNTSEKSDAYVDVRGSRFNPDLHRVDADGIPIKTKSGYFSRRRGTKATLNLPPQRSTASPASAANDAGGGDGTPPPPADYAKTAANLITTIEGTAVSMLGDHWALSKAERAGFLPHVTRICEDGDINDLPPYMALTLLGSAYVMSRATMPETNERIEQIKKSIMLDAVKSGYNRVKSWLDFGAVGMRKDDLSPLTR